MMGHHPYTEPLQEVAKVLSPFRVQRTPALLLSHAAVIIGMSLPVSACATWFRPVVKDKGTVQTFCGIEGPESLHIVVAVHVEDAVEDATFLVEPVVNGDPAPQLAAPPLEHVNLPARTNTCVRVPLPSSSADIRKYNISVFGYSGRERVNGGKIGCSPTPVTNWDCKFQ